MADKDKVTRRCSFCGRTEKQATQLISAPSGVCICEECVAVCEQMIEQSNENGKAKSASSIPTLAELPKPAQIKAILDEYVIGQDSAKIALSVAVYNHYKRI